MNRTLTATALAAALLSTAALDAAAAPVDQINRTYTLACQAGATDGTSLKTNQIIVRNTTPHVIQEKTLIRLMLRTDAGKLVFRAAGTHRSLGKGDQISVGDAKGIKSCIAQVKLQPNLKSKIDAKVGKLTR